MNDFLTFAVTVVGIAIVLIFLGVKVVRQAHAYTVERFGKFTRVLGPGLHLILPFIERIGARLSLQEQVLEIPRQEVITKDNASVQVDGISFFQVLQPEKAAYEVLGLESAIQNLAMTNLRTVIGSMDLDQVLSERDQINNSLLKVIDAATHSWGVKVTRVEIKDISPPKSILDAMSKQMMAEREKRAVILEAEGLREAAIAKANGEKQAAILQADGRLEAAKRDASARERLAEAEAKATNVVSEAIAKGGVQAVQYFLGLKYVEALEEIGAANNHKIVFMPLEATGMIGAIGGIAELLNQRTTTPPKRV